MTCQIHFLRKKLLPKSTIQYILFVRVCVWVRARGAEERLRLFRPPCRGDRLAGAFYTQRNSYTLLWDGGQMVPLFLPSSCHLEVSVLHSHRLFFVLCSFIAQHSGICSGNSNSVLFRFWKPHDFFFKWLYRFYAFSTLEFCFMSFARPLIPLSPWHETETRSIHQSVKYISISKGCSFIKVI